MRVIAMKYHGPGWTCIDGEVEFMLWAPRPDRPLWSACYVGEEGGFHRDDDPRVAAATAFARCPDAKLADQATQLLIREARQAAVRRELTCCPICMSATSAADWSSTSTSPRANWCSCATSAKPSTN